MACLNVENPWGLVIIASAFWIQFVAFGMATSFGVYIVELLRHFDVSLAFISLIGSINVGIFLGAGQCSMSQRLIFPLKTEAILYINVMFKWHGSLEKIVYNLIQF